MEVRTACAGRGRLTLTGNAAWDTAHRGAQATPEEHIGEGSAKESGAVVAAGIQMAGKMMGLAVAQDGQPCHCIAAGQGSWVFGTGRSWKAIPLVTAN